MFIYQCSLLFLHNNHSSPHIKNTQLIYNNTNNKNIFYHYIFHKTYTHTILISSKHVFNQAYYILPKLAIDSKGNKSSTSDYCFKPNGQTTYHRVVHNISQNHNDPTVRSPWIWIKPSLPENGRATVQHARNLAGEWVSDLHRLEWRQHLGAPHILEWAWFNGGRERNQSATKLPCRCIPFLFSRKFPMMLSVKRIVFLPISPVR